VLAIIAMTGAILPPIARAPPTQHPIGPFYFSDFFSLLDASVAVKTTIVSLPFISPPFQLASLVVLKIKKSKNKSQRCCGRVTWAIGRGTAAAMAIVTNPLMSDHQNCVRRVTGVWHQAFLFLAIYRILGTPKKRSQCKRYKDFFGKKKLPKEATS